MKKKNSGFINKNNMYLFGTSARFDYGPEVMQE